jgi:hypothetical protein
MSNLGFPFGNYYFCHPLNVTIWYDMILHTLHDDKKWIHLTFFVTLIWNSHNTYKLAFDGYFLHPSCGSTFQSIWGQTCWHEDSHAFWYSKWCLHWISQLESWLQFHWILSGLLQHFYH